MTNLEDLNETGPIFACDMGAIESAQREGHIENTKQLLGMLQVIEERPDGYALKLPLDSTILLKATQFIDLERLCCPFFGFSLELAPNDSSFWLRLTGPE